MEPDPRRSRPVSIRDVAARAGVSVTTVSHVLTGNRPVNARTATRVKQVIDDTGYVPAPYARSLQSGRTDMIGLLVPDIRNAFFGEIARGVEDVAFAHGCGLMVGNTSFDAAREDAYLEFIRHRMLDGLVYAAGSPPSAHRLATLDGRYPVVLVDEDVPGLRGASRVRADHRGGGALVARLLGDLGHEDVLVLAGPPGLPSGSLRAEGFLAQFGGRTRVEHGDFTREGGRALTHRVWEGGTRVTAVVAANDLVALGALDALRERGVGVPSEVSLVGFDDVRDAALADPPLTTVRQPAYEMGRAAAEALLQASVDDRVFPVELVERDSVRAAADRG
jgi:LacI family transcriptional regulator